MPRWTSRMRPSSRPKSRYLPRRSMRGDRAGRAAARRSRPRSAGAGGARARSTAAMRAPTTCGSSERRVVSTSGSSGMIRSRAALIRCRRRPASRRARRRRRMKSAGRQRLRARRGSKPSAASDGARIVGQRRDDVDELLAPAREGGADDAAQRAPPVGVERQRPARRSITTTADSTFGRGAKALGGTRSAMRASAIDLHDDRQRAVRLAARAARRGARRPRAAA